jgi:Crp-like helix-turn-helix domain
LFWALCRRVRPCPNFQEVGQRSPTSTQHRCPGGSIAELPVFDGGSYPASAAAIDDATLLFVSKQDFQALCLAHPQVALKVLRVVGARLRRLVGIIEELSFTTVRHRLASFLFRLSQKEGKHSATGVVITLPVSNQELASQIGTVRELVSRNLSPPTGRRKTPLPRESLKNYVSTIVAAAINRSTKPAAPPTSRWMRSSIR